MKIEKDLFLLGNRCLFYFLYFYRFDRSIVLIVNFLVQVNSIGPAPNL